MGFVSGCVGLLYCVYKGESQYIRHLTDKTAADWQPVKKITVATVIAGQVNL